LIAEVAATSASYDLHEKSTVYRRNGVREYIVWRVRDGELDWFILRKSEYQQLAPEGDTHRSKVFPGLWLDTAALLSGDLARVLAVLRQGIGTAEHTSFAESLKRPLGT
jgi:hypothetical protein